MSKNISNNIIHYKIPLRGLKVSTNKFYAGIHWTKRKEIKDGIISIARGFCRPILQVKSYPVQIEYRFFFSSRSLDTLNTAVMAKIFEDAFRAFGILQDDSPKFVGKSILEVIEIPKSRGKKKDVVVRSKDNEENEDYLEITIKSYESK